MGYNSAHSERSQTHANMFDKKQNMPEIFKMYLTNVESTKAAGH